MKLKTLYISVIVFLVSAASSLLGLTNEDVVKMFEAGLSEETVIVAIRNDTEPEFDTSAMALVELKNASVSEPVIQAMLKKAGGEAEESGTSSDDDAEASSVAEKFPDVPSSEVMPPEIAPVTGRSYRTRINFWYERGKSLATNYTRGIMVPINTEVTLEEIGRKDFTITLPSGESVRIVNVPDYTGESVEGLAKRYLAGAETDVDEYGDLAAKQIRTGVLRLGMTKDQVILTRGYPPVHETPSLESDRWVYWSSRFVKHTIVFANGRLSEGRGIY